MQVIRLQGGGPSGNIGVISQTAADANVIQPSVAERDVAQSATSFKK